MCRDRSARLCVVHGTTQRRRGIYFYFFFMGKEEPLVVAHSMYCYLLICHLLSSHLSRTHTVFHGTICTRPLSHCFSNQSSSVCTKKKADKMGDMHACRSRVVTPDSRGQYAIYLLISTTMPINSIPASIKIKQRAKCGDDVDVDKNDTVAERERERGGGVSFIVSALGAVSRCPTRNMPLSLTFFFGMKPIAASIHE